MPHIIFKRERRYNGGNHGYNPYRHVKHKQNIEELCHLRYWLKQKPVEVKTLKQYCDDNNLMLNIAWENEHHLEHVRITKTTNKSLAWGEVALEPEIVEFDIKCDPYKIGETVYVHSTNTKYILNTCQRDDSGSWIYSVSLTGDERDKYTDEEIKYAEALIIKDFPEFEAYEKELKDLTDKIKEDIDNILQGCDKKPIVNRVNVSWFKKLFG